ncbi:MAG TPA: DEAD/DEAH box helicase [Mycobacteriales bacterium]|nr:DEAD/DEAH box helicase [Mycobacteriales bacterium]
MSPTATTSGVPVRPATPDVLAAMLRDPSRAGRITHVERVPGRPGRSGHWPSFVAAELLEGLFRVGIHAPWAHQVEIAELAWAGVSTVVATGTASGKSLGYLLPTLSAAISRGATTLYLSPTKALAADQLHAIESLGVSGARAATFDGDTAYEERDWVRSFAHLVLTNPDMLHRSLLPRHERWGRFLARLEFVVVDECHGYRGVFGSHMAALLRRLRRVAEHHGASPTFLLASATVAEPAQAAARLIGLPVTAVVDDATPRAEMAFVLWEPPLLDPASAGGGRRSATAETADLLAHLVASGVRTLAFVRSRRGAEAVAMSAQNHLADVPGLGNRVAAYRGGYLAEERRALECGLREGELVGMATTPALELGINVAGLDVVLIAGYPGTRAALVQQAGRAGRAGRGAIAVLVGSDNALDRYLLHHPEALFGQPVEASIFDPGNPYVLGPHLAAAAAELPLTDADLPIFGAGAPALVESLVDQGLLRRRSTGWYWTHRERAGDLVDLRGVGGSPVRVVEEGTGRLLGTVDSAASHAAVHDGALYLHQGESYLVRRLEVEDAVAFVEPTSVDYTTVARGHTDLRINTEDRRTPGDGATLCFGTVDITHRVVSYIRRRVLTGEILGEDPLDLPERQLRTRAVWWTASEALLAAAAIESGVLAGAAHAAEHAATSLLPLFATCDRWDIGGVSTALHVDTGMATIFVYDGHPGGAGFAERGYAAGRPWLRASAAAVAECPCLHGCPSCVQSPICWSGNALLEKRAGARLLLATVAAISD